MEYYKEWLSYITEGIDLNPYIQILTETPYKILTPHRLERVLSYNIDTKKEPLGDNNLWLFRQERIENYKNQLKEEYPNEDESSIEIKQLFPFYFSHKTFSLTNLRDYAESISTHPGLHDTEIPFLVQAYREYEKKTKDQKKNMTFEKFIQTHPAVLYHPKHSTFLIPYIDGEMNVMSRLFRRYNEFSKDVNEHKTNIEADDENSKDYNEIEDKKAFTKFILEIYK